MQKYGKKQFAVDENKRDTYKKVLACGDGQTILDAFEGEWKKLMPVRITVNLKSQGRWCSVMCKFLVWTGGSKMRIHIVILA